jgi:serine phosphatase RsbU (regulator of sigma subunit)
MVWGLTQDSQNGLWIALENGISRVEFESPFQPVNPESGYSGNIESINKLGRYIFLGTTTGLHYGLETDLKFNRIGKISEPCWSVEPISTSAGKSLLVASRSGLYMVDANNQVQILAAGNYGCAKQLTKQPNIIVVGTPNTIDFFRIVGEKPVLSYRINNIDGEKQSIEQDRFGNLWIGTRDHGVLFIDGAGLGVTRHHNFVWLDDANGLPSVGENKVFSLFNKIFVSGFDGIFELAGYHGRLKIGEIARLKFQEADWLTADFFRDKKMDDTRQVWALSQDQEGRVHLSTRFKNNFEVILASPQRAGKFVWEANTYRVLPNDQVRAIFHDDQGISYLGGAEFLYRFERNKKIDVNSPAECLVRFLVTGEDTLYYGDGIANKDNSVLDIEPIEYNRDFVFFFSSTFYSSNLSSQFSTFLEGEDKNWSAWSENATRSFSRLWPGTYTLKVKARNPYGVTGKVAEFRFRIIPPWYLTWWAFVLYFIAVVFILIAIVKIYTIGLNRIIRSQTVEIIEQKNLIENKNKEITDSIWYAKRIQDAIMPAGDYFSGLFPRSFIILRPKDIVSGDFYWANERGNEKILVAADCTGHGVPGAFMSMMGHDYLNEIIIDKRVTSPDEILNLLRAGIIKALKQRGEEGGSKDGMDVSLIRFNETEGTIDFAGANNPIYIIRSVSFSAPDGFNFQIKSGSFILYEFKGDKFPVGIHYGTLAPFTSKTIRVLPGDRIYMFSDGFADQFGGPHGKKLKNIQFKNFLLETAQLNISSQSDFLIKQFDRWKGSLEQVDDVLVLGIEI